MRLSMLCIFLTAAATAVIGAGAQILGGILSSGIQQQQQQQQQAVGSSVVGGAHIGVGSNLVQQQQQQQQANIGSSVVSGIGGVGGVSNQIVASQQQQQQQQANIGVGSVIGVGNGHLVAGQQPGHCSACGGFRSLSLGEKEAEPSPPKDDPHVRTGKSEKGGYHVWIGNPGKEGEDGINRETGVFERHVEHGPITANVQINQ